MPAEYYASSTPDLPAVFPRWAPAGCGIVSLVVLVLLFAGGSFVGGGGMGKALDLVFGGIQSEVEKGFSADVTAVDRTAFSSEMTRFRANLRADRVQLTTVQPLLALMRDLLADSKIDREESERLNGELHRINTAPPTKKSTP